MNLDTILGRLADNVIPVFWDLIPFFFMIAGALIIVAGLFNMGFQMNRGRLGGHGGEGAVMLLKSLMVGGVLVSMPSVISMFTWSIFDQAPPTGLVFTGQNEQGSGEIIKFAVYAIMTVGVYGFGKGWMLFRKSQQNGGGPGAAITHILGGIIAINFVTFANLFGAEIGGPLESTISTLLGR